MIYHSLYLLEPNLTCERKYAELQYLWAYESASGAEWTEMTDK